MASGGPNTARVWKGTLVDFMWRQRKMDLEEGIPLYFRTCPECRTPFMTDSAKLRYDRPYCRMNRARKKARAKDREEKHAWDPRRGPACRRKRCRHGFPKDFAQAELHFELQTRKMYDEIYHPKAVYDLTNDCCISAEEQQRGHEHFIRVHYCEEHQMYHNPQTHEPGDGQDED